MRTDDFLISVQQEQNLMKCQTQTYPQGTISVKVTSFQHPLIRVGHSFIVRFRAI